MLVLREIFFSRPALSVISFDSFATKCSRINCTGLSAGQMSTLYICVSDPYVDVQIRCASGWSDCRMLRTRRWRRDRNASRFDRVKTITEKKGISETADIWHRKRKKRKCIRRNLHFAACPIGVSSLPKVFGYFSDLISKRSTHSRGTTVSLKTRKYNTRQR